MHYNFSFRSRPSLSFIGETQVIENIIAQDGCGYVRSSENSETLFIGIDVMKAYEFGSQYFNFLLEWVSGVFDLDKSDAFDLIQNNDFGIAINIEYKNKFPAFYISFAGRYNGRTFSESVLCKPDVNDESLIWKYITMIRDAIHQGKARMIAKIAV